jgi:hypothetical protein
MRHIDPACCSAEEAKGGFVNRIDGLQYGCALALKYVMHKIRVPDAFLYF